MQSEVENREAFATIHKALADLERRLACLENREELVVVEARSAARTGAADAMQGVILQIGERLGALEASAQPKRITRKRPTPDNR